MHLTGGVACGASVQRVVGLRMWTGHVHLYS